MSNKLSNFVNGTSLQVSMVLHVCRTKFRESSRFGKFLLLSDYW